jgi:hypothetical protein
MLQAHTKHTGQGCSLREIFSAAVVHCCKGNAVNHPNRLTECSTWPAQTSEHSLLCICICICIKAIASARLAPVVAAAMHLRLMSVCKQLIQAASGWYLP